MLMFIFFFNLEIFGIFSVIYMMTLILFSDQEYNLFFSLTDVNFWMLLLVVIMYLMLVMVEFYYKMSLNFLFIVLVNLLSVSSLVSFFLLYEMVFILIMFTIILLGYSYERLLAAFLMMFYSFLFSSPTLMMVLLFDYTFLMKEWLSYSFLINYFLVGSFMVKFPIFGFHYWLPVAHVEASTVGSMLLAGILLKLGCLGLIYVVSYLKFMVKFHWLGFSVLLVMLMILSLSDLKMMIAYSSVAHMSLVFYILMLGTNIGKKGALYMMFYHGFISPLMFWMVGLLMWWKTRSLLVIKMISFSYLFIFILFFLLILNMGFPPFMGFMSEILLMKSLTMNFFIMMILIFSILFSCYYNIYLFWCFNSFMGMVYKSTIFGLDMFMFMLISVILILY